MTKQSKTFSQLIVKGYKLTSNLEGESMSAEDQAILQQLNAALIAAVSDVDDVRNPATTWILELRKNDPKKFTFLLIMYLACQTNPNRTRALAAILIYSVLHLRTIDLQRKFNMDWIQHLNPAVREQLRTAATIGLFTPDPSLSTQCANLLGLFYSIEFPFGFFKPQIQEMLKIASSSPNINERIASLVMFSKFAQSCIDFNPNCCRDQCFQQLTNSLFEILLIGMESSIPELAHVSITALMSPLTFYERPIYFDARRNHMMSIAIEYMKSADDTIATDGYALVRKVIDCFYSLVGSYMPSLLQVIEVALNNGSESRKIAACLLLQTIGDVESDIQSPDQTLVKARHREFPECFGYSIRVLSALFQPLVMMICDCPSDETEAKVSLEMTPQMAAFSCFSNLAKAADMTALEPIFDFVKINGNSEDWRLRFASVMLLNAATRLPSFAATSNNNYLIAFDFFCSTISDQIPRVVEVAMWSLGRIISDVPDLVVDPQRFAMICSKVPDVLQSSATLASRCCWVLHFCFLAFGERNDESANLLAANFDVFCDLLLQTANQYDTDTVEAAYAAINDLVMYAPAGIEDAYNRLFEKVTAKLGKILQETGRHLTTTLELHHTIWICSIVQTITMYVSERIAVISDDLIKMLFQLIHSTNGDLIAEVLPAIGAIARAIKDKFTPYAQQLIPLLDNLLHREEFIQPAAVLVGDLYSSLDVIPKEVTDRFVASLFEAFNIETLSRETKNAIISVLGTQIAQNIGKDCEPWLDIFLTRLEEESRAAMEEKDAADFEYAKQIHLTILLSFQTLVPILAQFPYGFKKVRSFFYIFDQIIGHTNGDVQVLGQAVFLIGMITEKFGRRLNVVLNKPHVIQILEYAIKIDTEEIVVLATNVLNMVRAC
ncbi:hypothetical protein TRFO_13628 [Tritrichomonas foetus]|uniref:Importin subunit beta-1/Transportin-1-like TPR repeats domain-containing protein n=1 Tax=Tritrichomonas foetus TaxID=1144522 RepID=A0A1J4KXG7_9EUKA|nr:hypothetical protein TRFO_13628 [Tritrichomonas foetus]|eukprot:OHT15945.1 hypothetical protein TRFO_13628 [Tritrichomonas foetus]